MPWSNRLKVLSIAYKPRDASESMHVETIKARESKQAYSGREIPSSPEIWNSDNNTLNNHEAQNQAACRLTMPTSQDQPVPDNDDDDSYRPAPSELDSDEIIRGDMPLDVNTSKDCHRAPKNTGKGLEVQAHMLPDQETIEQAVKSHPTAEELRDITGRGQKHRANNEPNMSQTHL